MAEGRLLKWIYPWRVRTALLAFLVTLVLAKPTLSSIMTGLGL